MEPGTISRWVAISALAFAAACGGGGKGSGNLSVSARSAATAPATSTGISLGGGIEVTEIRVAVAKVALEAGGDGADAADAGGGDSAAVRAADQGGGDGAGDGGDGAAEMGDEAKVGPCLVDLTGTQLAASTGAVTPVCAGTIPDGMFEEMEMAIGPVAAADAAGVPGLAAMGGASVIVDGTFNGTAFSFRSSLEVRQKTEAPFTVSASSNVTITLDPTGWFMDGGGGVLDPTQTGNQSAIEQNIRASIRSFEDDNRDGHEDGGSQGGSGM